MTFLSKLRRNGYFEIKKNFVAQGTCEEGIPVRQGAVYLFIQPIILRVGDFFKVTRRKKKND